MRTDLYRVNIIVGTSPRLYFASPPVLNDAPEVGDLVSFGIYDRETLRLLVRDIEPGNDLTAKLTLIAEAPGVHVAENGPIPPYVRWSPRRWRCRPRWWSRSFPMNGR